METKVDNKEIYIKFKDGEKESEIKMQEIGEHHKLSVIDGLFKFFDVHVDFQEMAETYVKVGRAYRDFFRGVDDVVISETNEVFTSDEKEAEVPNEKTNDSTIQDWNWQNNAKSLENDFIKTGIKIRFNKEHYRCHYICPSCKNRGNHYIRETDRIINCYECNTHMKVSPSTKQGFPHTDSFKNFFIAGDYKREELNEEDINGDS